LRGYYVHSSYTVQSGTGKAPPEDTHSITHYVVYPVVHAYHSGGWSLFHDELIISKPQSTANALQRVSNNIVCSNV